MIIRALADLVLLAHLGFILFVVLGGIAVRWRRWMAVLHLPCAVYGVAVEYRGRICPLTPLENRLRALGGEQGYRGGFVEHYLAPIVYPEAFSPAVGIALAVALVGVNLAIYAWALRRHGSIPEAG
jgi:hypothetical protein